MVMKLWKVQCTAGFDRESEMKSCKALCTGHCSELLEDENNRSFPAGQH